jgi:Family of unknown function (DUF6152)
MTLKVIGVIPVVIAFGIASVSAHHSAAIYDSSKTLTVTGTITSFQWTNPHSWLDVQVKNKRGQIEKWSFEMASPPALATRGLKPKSILPGDQVTVTFHPLKEGAVGGKLLNAKFAKGLNYTEGNEAAPRAGNPYP